MLSNVTAHSVLMNSLMLFTKRFMSSAEDKSSKVDNELQTRCIQSILKALAGCLRLNSAVVQFLMSKNSLFAQVFKLLKHYFQEPEVVLDALFVIRQLMHTSGESYDKMNE